MTHEHFFFLFPFCKFLKLKISTLMISLMNSFFDNSVSMTIIFFCSLQYGGFSKFPGELPELYHSYYGFSAYSLLEEPSLNSLCIELGLTKRAAYGT